MPVPFQLKYYIAIARPDHWFKNIFVIPGFALALLFQPQALNLALLNQFLIAMFAVCLSASANYTINEWLDAEFDQFHPVKKNRPSAAGKVEATWVYVQWAILTGLSIAISLQINWQFSLYVIALLVMGIIYNVKPMRSKDRIYMDVLSESINNPLRLLLGWAIILPNTIPPSSMLITYWMGGAYLMAIKRYAEYRFIDNPSIAGAYRRSFSSYTESNLLLSAFFYALSATFFAGVFLIKYRIEYVLAIPFLAFLFVWYLDIGMRKNSVTQNPEKLYREPKFGLYLSFLCILLVALSVLDIPQLRILVEPIEFG